MQHKLTKQSHPVYREFNFFKGVGIYLVVLGHMGDLNTNVIHFIYSFHMPLFFFVSGFFYKKDTIQNFLLKRGKRILIPYFFFSFLTYFVYRNANGEIFVGIFDLVFGTLSGISNGQYLSWNVVLWYLPCTFIITLLYTTFDIYNKKWILIFVFLFFLYFSNDDDLFLPYHLNSGFLLLPFFWLGTIIKKYYYYLDKFNNIAATIVLIVVGGYIAFFNTQTPDVRVNIIGNPMLFYVAGSLLILGFLYFSRIFKKEIFINFLGVNSLLIMCLHIKFSIVSRSLEYQWFHLYDPYLTSILICVLLVIPILLINRFLPIIAGRA